MMFLSLVYTFFCFAYLFAFGLSRHLDSLHTTIVISTITRIIVLPFIVALAVTAILNRAAGEGEDGWDHLLQNSPDLCDFSFEHHERLGYLGMMALQRPVTSQDLPLPMKESEEAECIAAHTEEHEEPVAVQLANEALKIVGLELWEAHDPDDGLHETYSHQALQLGSSGAALPARESDEESCQRYPANDEHPSARTAGSCAMVDHCQERCTGGHKYILRSRSTNTPSQNSSSSSNLYGPDKVALPQEFTS